MKFENTMKLSQRDKFKIKKEEIELVLDDWLVSYNVIQGLDGSNKRVSFSTSGYRKLLRQWLAGIDTGKNNRRRLFSLILYYEDLAIEIVVDPTYCEEKEIPQDVLQCFKSKIIYSNQYHITLYDPQDLPMILNCLQ